MAIVFASGLGSPSSIPFNSDSDTFFFLLKHLPDIQECSMIVVQREANVKLDNVKLDNVKLDNVKIDNVKIDNVKIL